MNNEKLLYNALFIHINLDNIHNKANSHSELFEQSLSTLALTEVYSCYMCLHYGKGATTVIPSIEAIDTYLLRLLEHMPKLIEYSMELFDTPVHKNILEHYICSIPCKKTLCNQNNEPIHRRIVLPWAMLQHCDPTVIQSIADTQNSISLQLAIDSCALDSSVLDFLMTIDNTRTQAISHISIEWNVEEEDREQAFARVARALQEYNLTPYQYWNFSLPQKESIYLQSIYALRPYLGLNVGEGMPSAISWKESSAMHSAMLGSYQGNHSKNILDNIEWDLVDPEHELEIRIMQGRYSEYVCIPPHLIAKLQALAIDLEGIMEKEGYTYCADIGSHILSNMSERGTLFWQSCIWDDNCITNI